MFAPLKRHIRKHVHFQRRPIRRHFCNIKEKMERRIYTRDHLWLEKCEDEEHNYYVGFTRYILAALDPIIRVTVVPGDGEFVWKGQTLAVIEHTTEVEPKKYFITSKDEEPKIKVSKKKFVLPFHCTLLEANEAYDVDQVDDYVFIVSDDSFGSWKKMTSKDYGYYILKEGEDLERILSKDK